MKILKYLFCLLLYVKMMRWSQECLVDISGIFVECKRRYFRAAKFSRIKLMRQICAVKFSHISCSFLSVLLGL